MTNDTRHAVKQLRRWCPRAMTHQRADDPVCGWDHGGATHRLRLRTMLVCDRCGQGYFTMRDFDRHDCGDAY